MQQNFLQKMQLNFLTQNVKNDSISCFLPYKPLFFMILFFESGESGFAEGIKKARISAGLKGRYTLMPFF